MRKPNLKTTKAPRAAKPKPASSSNPSIPPALAGAVAKLPKVLQDAHRRTSRYIASIEQSGVVYFTKARTNVEGWVQLGNVENAKSLPMGIEVPISRLIYVAEEGDAGE